MFFRQVQLKPRFISKSYEQVSTVRNHKETIVITNLVGIEEIVQETWPHTNVIVIKAFKANSVRKNGIIVIQVSSVQLQGSLFIQWHIRRKINWFKETKWITMDWVVNNINLFSSLKFCKDYKMFLFYFVLLWNGPTL